jgi:hypothetical protein
VSNRKGGENMKKSVIILMALIFAAGLTSVSFAQTKAAKTSSASTQAQIVKGKIVSIDKANNQVTIKDASGTDKTVSVSAAEITSLKTGEEIKVTLKAGTNEAASVKHVVKQHKVHASK